MDRTYIESQRVVARYLSGDLTVREARQFEKYCLENREWLNTQPIPVRLKAKMVRKPGEELDANDLSNMPSNVAIEAAQLDDADDDRPPAEFGALQPIARRWIMALSVMLVVSILGIAAAIWYASSLSEELNASKQATKDSRLRPPNSVREYRITPSKDKPAAATVNVGWLDPPQLLDLRIDMSEGRYNTFLVTVSSVSAGHIMQVRRVARDSNGELRLNLNSSSFGPGEYDLKLDGYTWRGETVPVGWVRLGMK
jgi:hypothetical protein